MIQTFRCDFRILSLTAVVAAFLLCREAAADVLLLAQKDDLYKRAFGAKPPELPEALKAIAFIDELEKGELTLEFSPDRVRFSLPTHELIAMLDDRVDSIALHKIHQAGRNGQITNTDLAQLGIQASFNLARFSLDITTDASIRKPRTIHLSGSAGDRITDVPAAAVSGYMNFFARQGYRSYSLASRHGDTSAVSEKYLQYYLDSTLNARKILPFLLSSDVALRLFPVVLEGRYTINTGRAIPFMRGDVRAVCDLPAQSLSIRAGDDVFRLTGYQKYIRAGGVTVARDFSMQPYNPAYPVTEQHLRLNEPSQVQIVINDIVARTFSLDAGMYKLKDFHFDYGENDVKIVIRDIYGQEEVIAFDFFNDRRLLAKRKLDFSLFAGFPSLAGDWTYEYEFSSPILSGYGSFGLTDRINLGVNAQYHQANIVAGVSALFASRLGLLGLDAAFSLFNGETAGGAVKVFNTYHVKELGKTRPNHELGVQVELISSGFAQITDTAAVRDTPLRITAKYRKPVSPLLNTAIECAFSPLAENGPTYSITAGLSVRPARGLSIHGQCGYGRDKSGHEFPVLSFRGIWSFSTVKHTVAAGQAVQMKGTAPIVDESDSRWNNNTNVVWDYRSSYSLSDYYSASAGVLVDSYNNLFRAKAGYTSTYGLADFSYTNNSSNSRFNPFNQHGLNAEARTALVFAGSHFGLSRPVSNSFIMVTGKGGARSTDILVNPSLGGYDAIKRGPFPGIVAEFPRYSTRNITLQPKDMIPDMATSLGEHNIVSGYKTGHVITLGARRTIVVYGTLMLPGGTPAANRYVTIRNLSDKNATDLSTFTSSTGRFSFAGVPKSVYSISLDRGGDDRRTVKLEVRDTKEEHYEVVIEFE